MNGKRGGALRPLWSAALVLVVLLAGCSSPAPLPDQLSRVPVLTGEALIVYHLQKYAKEYPLGARLTGSPRAIAEAYLRRYQPGTLPRVFESSVVYDREGKLLGEIFEDGRRTWAPLSRISPHLLDAVIATEDATFYQNNGIEPRRLVGALLQNTRSSDVVAGASTITMQLARMLFMPPEERFNRSLDRKITEALLAQDLTRLYTKDELLEMYLNMAYFGHLAYGPEAAARTYFGKSAADLTLNEASLLAGLPQQPALLDPYINVDGAKARQRIVLDLMVRRGYITQAEADAAHQTPIALTDDPNLRPQLAPHFMQYLTLYLARAPQQFNLARSGLTIKATLDLDMQNMAQEVVRQNVDALRPRFNLNNAALMALKPGTAEILVMVGSADYNNNAIDGQVNVALRQRQPGSSIKPIVYSTAIDHGLVSPATLLWDLPVTFPMADGKNYRPVNYDSKFRGPVTVRTALANSLNVPTVKMFDGIEPSDFVTTAVKMGLTSFDPASVDRYGLATALGGQEVSLFDLTTAYHTIANGGRFVEPTPVREIMTSDGQRVKIDPTRQPVQAISPDTAFLISDIISDNKARAPVFGENSRLKLSRPAAAKTGTTTNFRDNWTMGFTKYLVAGVWAGNNNGQPMRNADGITGAAPIWNQFMEGVLANPAMLRMLGAPETEEGWDFDKPADVAQVPRTCPREIRCRDGGEYFAQSWLDKMAAAGAYADSFLSGIMAPVTVQLGSGQFVQPGMCVLRLTAPEDPQARSVLVLPRGVGRLTMQWTTPVASAGVTGTMTATTTAAALASAGSASGSVAGSVGVSGAVSGVVQVDASVAPLLLMDLPYLASSNQAVSDVSLNPQQPLVLTSNERVQSEQKAVMNWARSSGRQLVWGDCAHALEWARAVYGDSVRNVQVGQALGPDSNIAAAVQSPAQQPTPEPTPEEQPQDQYVAGNNGIAYPTGGAVLSGVVPVQATASLPDFWKWQLDILVDNQNASFVAVGERPTSGPASIVSLDTAKYPNGSHTLRLRVVHRDGNYEEFYAPITIAN